MAARRSPRLFAPRRARRTGPLLVLGLLLAALALTLALNSLSNRYVRLETQAITLPSLPRQLEGFRILHLSDLNAASLGSEQANLATALGKEGYDLVTLTGDMLGKSGRVQPLLSALSLLKPEVPVLFIAGDSDPGPLLAVPHGSGEVKEAWVQTVEATGAIYLETPYRLEHNGQVLWVCPGDLFTLDLRSAVFALQEQISLLQASENPYEPLTGAQLRHATHRLEVVEASLLALEQVKEGEVIIALTHHPYTPEQLGELAARAKAGEVVPHLVLAGQFNAGQARLPGLGPIYIPKQSDGRGGFWPGDEGFVGLSITKGLPQYISPGLGTSGYYPLPLRLFNRPAISLLRLTARMAR